jgi:hypothetical protein
LFFCGLTLCTSIISKVGQMLIISPLWKSMLFFCAMRGGGGDSGGIKSFPPLLLLF